MGLFGSKAESRSGTKVPRTSQRSSRGWTETLGFLKEREGLRVLDFGATSSSNINFLTSLGQSVYMANVVEDATRDEWMTKDEDDPKGGMKFDAERFAAANLDFSGKDFDAVLLWDTADYLPPAAVPLLFEKLRERLHPQGRLLAFFHGKKDDPGSQFSRFHVGDGPELTVQPVGDFAVQQAYPTRQIEKFLAGYGDVRFLLGKDNVREVIATR